MLLLIAVANTPYYLWGATTSPFASHPSDGSALDKAVDFLVITTIDLRTYPMFAFLFGYGMMQLYNRQVSAGTSPDAARKLLQKRNVLLLVFGLAHAALLWMGDVLGAYGLAGLLMVWLFFRVRDRTLVVWTWALGGMLTLVTVMAVVGAYFVARLPADSSEARSIVADFGPSTDSMAATSYLDSVPERLSSWMLGTIGQGLLMLVVPMMLLVAFWAGRRRILESPGEHLPLLRRVAVAGIAIGWLGPVPSALDHVGVDVVPDHAAWVFLPVQILTGFFGGLGYVALFGLLGHRLARRRSGAVSGTPLADGPFAGAVQAVGKRSLTSYLMQSLLCAPVLAAWGLGLGEHLGSTTMVLYAVGVWGVTVAFAVWQERTGRRGPAEVALRRLAYGPPRPASENSLSSPGG